MAATSSLSPARPIAFCCLLVLLLLQSETPWATDPEVGPPSPTPACPVRFCDQDVFVPWPPPCSCEAECVWYGDCCEDAPGLLAPDGANISLAHPVDAWSCREFPSKHKCPESVYMIDRCPAGTDSALAARCVQDTNTRHKYTFLQDLPVKSALSGVVYGNIFCARCHYDDLMLDPLDAYIQCETVTSNYQVTPIEHQSFLALMEYHPGQLRWTTRLTDQLFASQFNSTDLEQFVNQTVACALYLGIEGQTCQEVVRACGEEWPDDEIREGCSSYTYLMYTGDKVYKNYDCALCNHVLTEDLDCSPSIDSFHTRVCAILPSSVLDLFQVYGDCDEPQLWNPLTKRCEDIISSCVTQDYHRNQSVLYPDFTIFLNETKETYKRGEYEIVNEDYVRVCSSSPSSSASAVPLLTMISTALMLVSLVCMFLHMCVFLLQFQRRSVPRLTHFFMVCSLFIAELLFLVVFKESENYTACVVYACLTYYFFSVAFFWMNVISFDTCRAFYSHTCFKASFKTFVYYFAYANGVPLGMSISAVLVNHLTTPSFYLHPSFGTHHCWFNNKWGLVAFFICPVLLILISNVCMFVVSIYQIYRQQKAAQFASQTAIRGRKLRQEKVTMQNKSSHQNSASRDADPDRTSPTEEGEASEPVSSRARPQGTSSSETSGYSDRLQESTRQLRVLRDRLAIYSKVALIMGLTWVFALLSLFFDSLLLAYLNVVFNSLQGTFIFIAFDCTKENYRKLRDRLSGYRFNQSTEELDL